MPNNEGNHLAAPSVVVTSDAQVPKMSSVAYEDSEPEAKRRRLRKGTHSCWECKRRKVRCNFASPTDTICITCRRRGTKCVSQELPEEVPADNADRIERVEALLSQLVKSIHHNNGANDGSQTISGGQYNIAALAPSTTGSESAPSFMPLHEPLSVSV